MTIENQGNSRRLEFISGESRRQGEESVPESETGHEGLVRGKCKKQFEELYVFAGAPDGDPAKTELLNRIDKMESKELDFLEDNLHEIQGQYQEGKDKAVLLESLHALNNRDFHKGSQAETRSREDADKLDRLRGFLGTK